MIPLLIEDCIISMKGLPSSFSDFRPTALGLSLLSAREWWLEYWSGHLLSCIKLSFLLCSVLHCWGLNSCPLMPFKVVLPQSYVSRCLFSKENIGEHTHEVLDSLLGAVCPIYRCINISLNFQN